jgi:c-di-GMP-binding flagellar brake protein YcgR
MMDLSRGGASLVVSREIKVKAQVEVRFTLKTGAKPFVEVCEVVRATRIETSDKYGAGIRFLEIDAQDERTLVAFLEERQKRRRERGVV